MDSSWLELLHYYDLMHPSLALIRKFFINLKLIGNFSVTLLDQSHVLIKFVNDLDYSRVFCHQSYLFFNCFMWLTKWSPTVEIGGESLIVSIWISFPNLYPHFYSTRIFHGLGLFGNPLKVDNATTMGLRPSMARVLVKIDVTKKFADKIWLGPEKLRYFQQVVLEDLPLFCVKCKRLGHSSNSCCPAVHVKVVGENVESDIQLGGVLANKDLVVIADSCEGRKVEATVPEEGMTNLLNPIPLTSAGLLEEELGVPIDRDQLGKGCYVGSAIDLVPLVCSDFPVAGGLELCDVYGTVAPEGINMPGIMIFSSLSEGDEPLSKSIYDPIFIVPITLVPKEALHFHHSSDSEVLHVERILADTTPDDESFYEEDLDSQDNFNFSILQILEVGSSKSKGKQKKRKSKKK
ncbi:hypothetical protein M5K25_009773 [Dendrobium thyrsiflorum]|uniref:DUF4283 domain-containing protein n=1 Tax=Dendrobium thyrsiflorum TaxID=117978 RepID=A0ABD0V6L7_DENTH